MEENNMTELKDARFVQTIEEKEKVARIMKARKALEKRYNFDEDD